MKKGDQMSGIIEHNEWWNVRLRSIWFHSCHSKKALLCIFRSFQASNRSSALYSCLFASPLRLKMSLEPIKHHSLNFIPLKVLIALDLSPYDWALPQKLFVLYIKMTKIHAQFLHLQLTLSIGSIRCYSIYGWVFYGTVSFLSWGGGDSHCIARNLRRIYIRSRTVIAPNHAWRGCWAWCIIAIINCQLYVTHKSE